MYGILSRQLFFVAAVVYSGSWDILYGRCKQRFVNELNYASFSRHFLKTVFEWLSLTYNTLLHLLLENGDFLNTNISQGSLATRLGCGKVFVYGIVTNFLLSLTVKEF